MCNTAITLISKALNEVENAEVLLKIKNVVALFIQTMEVYQITSLVYAENSPELGLGVFCHCIGCILARIIREVC